jgi:hypothetical protein
MSDDDSIRIMDALIVREAIASVALSHDDDCRCDICRASLGDEQAFEQVWARMRVGLSDAFEGTP